METTDTNKFAMALLGTLLFTMALGIFSSAVFAPHKAVKAGYDLPGVQEAAATPPPTSAAPEEPLPVLLAKADATKGQADTKACQSCHNFEKGAGAKVGPPLWGVVGRPVASIPGFAYSDGLKAMGGDWTYEGINKLITNPKADVAGTKMSYPGESDPHKRADILAYLQTLSDKPVPFPK
jgi:cytochrome c